VDVYVTLVSAAAVASPELAFDGGVTVGADADAVISGTSRQRCS
jgi:hypothetical protein